MVQWFHVATTITVSEETRKALQRIKLREDKRSLDEVLQDLLAEHRLVHLRKTQDRLGAHAKKLGLGPEDLFPDMLE